MQAVAQKAWYLSILVSILASILATCVDLGHKTASLTHLSRKTAAMSSDGTLTPEQLAALPHDDQASKLLARIWTPLSLATVFSALRIYCRMLKGQRLWWDDAILDGSWVYPDKILPVWGSEC
jgi:hypothetical protein